MSIHRTVNILDTKELYCYDNSNFWISSEEIDTVKNKISSLGKLTIDMFNKSLVKEFSWCKNDKLLLSIYNMIKSKVNSKDIYNDLYNGVLFIKWIEKLIWDKQLFKDNGFNYIYEEKSVWKLCKQAYENAHYMINTFWYDLFGSINQSIRHSRTKYSVPINKDYYLSVDWGAWASAFGVNIKLWFMENGEYKWDLRRIWFDTAIDDNGERIIRIIRMSSGYKKAIPPRQKEKLYNKISRLPDLTDDKKLSILYKLDKYLVDERWLINIKDINYVLWQMFFWEELEKIKSSLLEYDIEEKKNKLYQKFSSVTGVDPQIGLMGVLLFIADILRLDTVHCLSTKWSMNLNLMKLSKGNWVNYSWIAEKFRFQHISDNRLSLDNISSNFPQLLEWTLSRKELEWISYIVEALTKLTNNNNGQVKRLTTFIEKDELYKITEYAQTIMNILYWQPSH